jgi:hypothetical protein
MRTKIIPALVLFCLGICIAGCRTMKPLPAADLKQPGWKVQEGQAIMKRNASEPEIAGEIIVATNPDGRAYVQFSKNPFPLATAQSTPKGWQVEQPTEKKFYSGHGKPPLRLILLYLPRMMAGEPPPRGLSYEKVNDGYKIVNQKNGSSLEAYFTQ